MSLTPATFLELLVCPLLVVLTAVAVLLYFRNVSVPWVPSSSSPRLLTFVVLLLLLPNNIRPMALRQRKNLSIHCNISNLPSSWHFVLLKYERSFDSVG